MANLRLRAIDQRVLAVLQAEAGDGWIDEDRLISVADIRIRNEEDDDNVMYVVSKIRERLEKHGHQTEEHVEDWGTAFYRLKDKIPSTTIKSE